MTDYRPTGSSFSYPSAYDDTAQHNSYISQMPPPLKSSMRSKNGSPNVREKTMQSQKSSMERTSNSPQKPQILDKPLLDHFATGPSDRVTLLAGFLYVIRYFFIVAFVGMGLAVPLILYRTDKEFGYDDEDEDKIDAAIAKEKNNLIFYVFCWLEATWLAACVCHFASLIFPYIFFLIARYVNSAHRRYWRAFRTLKWPVTLFGASITSFISFRYLVNTNPLVISNWSRPNDWDWPETLDDILEQLIYWTILYLLEKMLILYISIHYHYRTDRYYIHQSKMVHSTLCSLYEVSMYLKPPYSQDFLPEDLLIHHHRAPIQGSTRQGAAKFLQKIGGAVDATSSFLWQAGGADRNSHWGKASSNYATVEYALEDPKSAAALAKRIWVSLVAAGRDALTVNDIAEAFGPHRREEAEACFGLLDENENGDIRLSEFVPTVVEVGRKRHAIYAGMHDINHAINTFNWVSLFAIAIVMLYFILVFYVDFIKSIQSTISFSVLGLAFAVGRTIHEFISGSIFIFFKHPFDVGDRVNLFNRADAHVASVIVKRISLLYVVFERVDDGTEAQWPNIQLAEKRVDNLTRSGRNQQRVALEIDFATPFRDIQLLRAELQAFLARRENARDYRPELGLTVASIGDMSRMELQCSVWHKSNWSDEGLRAYRASRFLCALIAAVRRVPINKPGGNGLKTGDEGKPSYQVVVSEEEAMRKRDEQALRTRQKRMDYVPPYAEADSPNAVGAAPSPASVAADRQATEDEEARLLREEEAQRELERQEAAAMEDFMAIPLERRPSAGVGHQMTAGGEGAQSSAVSAFPFIGGNEVGARPTRRGVPGADFGRRQSEGWSYGVAH